MIIKYQFICKYGYLLSLMGFGPFFEIWAEFGYLVLFPLFRIILSCVLF